MYYFEENMQVGCHISVVLKDQLILKIVYEKNLSLICRIFSAVLLKNYLASLFISVYMKVWLFHETLQPKYGKPVWPFFVQNSGYTSFIRRIPELQQVCHKLLKTALLQLCVNNLRQTC
jgi:hypothetical protein